MGWKKSIIRYLVAFYCTKLADLRKRVAPCASVPTPSPSCKIFTVGSYSLITSWGHCVFIFASRNPKVCLYFLAIIFTRAVKRKKYQISSNEKSCQKLSIKNIPAIPVL